MEMGVLAAKRMALAPLKRLLICAWHFVDGVTSQLTTVATWAANDTTRRLRCDERATPPQVDGVQGVALGGGLDEDAAHILGDDNPRLLNHLHST